MKKEKKISNSNQDYHSRFEITSKYLVHRGGRNEPRERIPILSSPPRFSSAEAKVTKI